MIIKKFQGKTKEEAWELAKNELGDNLVEMNVKTIKSKGFLGLFKQSMIELTVAKEENDKYNFAANRPVKEETTEQAESAGQRESALEEKIDTLQSLLEKQLSTQIVKESSETKPEAEEKVLVKEEEYEDPARVGFLKILYQKLLDNEVSEKYANDILDELDRSCKPDVTMDVMLSEIYQRMILKFGKPSVIQESSEGPKVVFFVGPTGVGKTTTIAKIASKFHIEEKKKVALLTADTYRIAAAEQLRTYANILQVPFRIVYTAEEINEMIKAFSDYDYILVDTTGHSPNNTAQKEDMQELIRAMEEHVHKEVFLVISASTKYRDLIRIADTYKETAEYKIIFTKLDETTAIGNMYNLRMYTGAALSYVTCGQNVPDDIAIFDPQVTVMQLLGGKR